MIEVHFTLAHHRDIVPWPTGGPHLSWYGLTYGSYELRMGGYRNVLDIDDEPVDYQVARLLEDLMDVAAGVVAEGSSYLDVGYLAGAPTLRFERIGVETIVVNRSDSGGGPAESLTLASDDFGTCVVQFGERLFDCMEERCAAIVRLGGIPGVRIDLQELQRQQSCHRERFDAARIDLF